MHAAKSLLPAPEKIPVIYVTTADALTACIIDLSKAKAIAFDLEFDRDHYSYGFNLCLMQMASTKHCYLVDPKANLDISFIFPLLENAAILKVAHCPGEDLRLLHALKCYPANLADTELYARLLNYERTSLGAMIQQLFGIELDKKMQKVNWEQRPLGADQLNYAANDVLYLLPMKEELEKQAAMKNLLPFLEDENNLLSTTIHNMEPKDNFLKKKDLLYLSPYRQYVLNGLFLYRDQIAKQQNKPAHYIMNEETTRTLAVNGIPQTEWPNIKGIHPVLKSSEGQNELFDHIEKLNTEASSKNLSYKKSSSDHSNEHFQTEKDRRDLLKATIFTPIQNEIASNFGEHAMRFIFSSATVDDILQGRLKIEEIRSTYRKMLIKNTAQKLGIDLSGFE
ncbi:MAG: ribonuclease D [Chitinophagaceae bacterium]|nr:ribonuclease D [Chitinophagaceae bacterium]